jgi:methyl-accepting chemotaxis protein
MPIRGRSGKPYKVLKIATDVTEETLHAADFEGQVQAIGRSQAVIQFELDGTVISANDKFLSAVGYTLQEIKGRHHRMFVDAETRDSAEYQRFWEDLRRGEYKAGEYRRVAKNGSEIWLQAAYNPGSRWRSFQGGEIRDGHHRAGPRSNAAGNHKPSGQHRP